MTARSCCFYVMQMFHLSIEQGADGCLVGLLHSGYSQTLLISLLSLLLFTQPVIVSPPSVNNAVPIRYMDCCCCCCCSIIVQSSHPVNCNRRCHLQGVLFWFCFFKLCLYSLLKLKSKQSFVVHVCVALFSHWSA